MTSREQFSWVWLVTLVVTYAGYFTWVVHQRTGPEPGLIQQLTMFGATAVIQVVIITIASIIIGLRKSPDDKIDERDRAIAHKAASVAYHVMMIGMILVGCFMPYTDTGWEIFNAAVFFIALSEATRLILVVLAYRRGVHG